MPRPVGNARAEETDVPDVFAMSVLQHGPSVGISLSGRGIHGEPNGSAVIWLPMGADLGAVVAACRKFVVAVHGAVPDPQAETRQ